MACPVNINRIVLFSLLFLVFFAFCLPGEASVRVEPSRFILHVAPGSRETGAITVTNNSDFPVTLDAVYYDWEMDEKFELVHHERGTLKETLDGLIRFNPRQFFLEPGQSQVVRFTVEFPEGEEEQFERRGIIFFEHLEEDPDFEGTGALLKTMIGTTIYIRPVEYIFSFRVIEEHVVTAPSGQKFGALLLANSSLVHVRFETNFKVLNSEGEMVEEGKIPELVILSEQLRPLYFPLQRVYSPGDYRLIVEFDFFAINRKVIENIPFHVGD